MLIFGSCAIKHWFSDFRIPKDFEIIEENNANAYWFPSFQYIVDNNVDTQYVDVNFMFTVKVSHLKYGYNFDKHIEDVLFLTNRECVLDEKLLKMLTIDWDSFYFGRSVHIFGKKIEHYVIEHGSFDDTGDHYDFDTACEHIVKFTKHFQLQKFPNFKIENALKMSICSTENERLRMFLIFNYKKFFKEIL